MYMDVYIWSTAQRPKLNKLDRVWLKEKIWGGVQDIFLWAPDALLWFVMFPNVSESFLWIFRAFGLSYVSQIIILHLSKIIFIHEVN
jgi:hypothetical protein